MAVSCVCSQWQEVVVSECSDFLNPEEFWYTCLLRSWVSYDFWVFNLFGFKFILLLQKASFYQLSISYLELKGLKVTQSCRNLWPHGLYSSWNSPARMLEWVAVPFSRGSAQPRDWTQVSQIAGSSSLPAEPPATPEGLPCSSNSKESACNTGVPGSLSGSGRSCGEENGNPLQYSCLENPMDRGAWWATVYGIPNSWTRLND